ncbi:hypothetical protein E2C01_070195 [Portunus trituberculatus]|uniref:Uncharacterized protein n=1 Tax=Portunus trituberculatus TaxID=210409 RepID=A0A5B7I1M1_PORTR|nr:hypothetical protein [Portunus trituberculatus]
MSLALRRVINVMQRGSGTVRDPSLLDPVINFLALHNTFTSNALQVPLWRGKSSTLFTNY